MVPEALQLLLHSTSAASHLWVGNCSWFPLSSWKVRSCSLMQEQVFHSFHFEEEARKKVCWISKRGSSHCPYHTANCNLSPPYLPVKWDLWALENAEAGSEQGAAENGLSCHRERSRKQVKKIFWLTGQVDQALCLCCLKGQQKKLGRVIEYEPTNPRNAGSSSRAIWALTNECKSDSGELYLSVTTDPQRSSCSKNFSSMSAFSWVDIGSEGLYWSCAEFV